MQTRLSTPVVTTPQACIGSGSHILLLGSCFTDSVGERMERCGLHTLRNPFGVLYNPYSIATCLDHCLTGRPVTDDMLVQHDGLWHSWLHHTTLSHPDRETCLQQCNGRIDAAHRFLQQCDTIVVTWGTAYAYFLITQPSDNRPLTDPLLVANCHKVAARHFERRRLDVEDIVKTWQPLLRQLAQLPQHPRVIFTVSPIRHLSDGANGNQISKSTLLLAIDRIISIFNAPIRANNDLPLHISYFPAYEIMMDELRDYRFYDRDMVHPSDLAVDIIWQRFQQTYLLPDAIEHCQQGEKIFRQSQHRPINP